MRTKTRRRSPPVIASLAAMALLGLALRTGAQPPEQPAVPLAEPLANSPAEPPAAQKPALGLTLQAFARLAPLRPAAFAAQWQALLDEDLSRLASAPEPARMRQRFLWAQGRVMQPYFHWRDAPAAGPLQQDPMLPLLLRELPLRDARWWPLPEVQSFWRAWLHEQARALLASSPDLRHGDARWLRAELAALERSGLPLPQRRELMGRLLAEHVEDNGSQGLDPLLSAWRRLQAPAAEVARLDEAVKASRAHDCCHESPVLRRWQGVDLRVHVLEPSGAAASAATRPAMLWLHGGSFTQGQWWHSPVISAALRQQGVLVLAVELRTNSRFDTGPLEQLSDASLAYDWLLRHAGRLRVDPQRIGVAGFSSGAVLALMAATHGLDTAPGQGPRPTTGRYPAAIISLGGCADPLNPRKDGWFRRRVEAVGPPAHFSPMATVATGQPPLLALHGTADEYCPFDDMERFVAAYQAAGNAAELVAIEGAPHFFGFFHRPGQARMREALAAALRRWGWIAE